VGGFGVPIAVVAPILVTMDFTALQAVVMASLGHAWAISFGSLGASYEALISATGMAGTEISPWMALYLGLVCFLVGFAVLWVAGGKIMLRRGLVYLLSMAVVMVTVQYLAAVTGLGNIAAMLGAVGGIFTGILWTCKRNTQPLLMTHIKEPPTVRNYTFLIPYVVLILIIFGINFINPLYDIVNKVIIQVAIPELIAPDHSVIPATKTKGLSLFGHPGALLIYAAIITLVLALRKGRLPPGSGSTIRQGVVRSGVKSTVGILAMMAMATTMQIAGMVNQLSTTMADLSGQFYPFVAPFIGALGAFMTGSNTNSNVLFGAFQQAVARSLSLYVPLVLAIHNAGAAVGSIFAPAKIIVGCSTVGLSGQESEALRISAQFGLLIVLIIAFVGMISTQFIHAPM
jgi:lactate permease